MKPQIIAYYLPQFHPFKENDEWWGKGFTEWTNVGKAKPLFKGHNQPRVPADLGYYDLRLPIVREQQVELAREAGVTGFCYWHYWFGNGVQLMNEIIDEVAASGKPDFPFCLGWANESWKAKQWNKDGKGDRVLVEQKYGGEKDYRAHYEYVRTLITNKNYIRIDGKPFFLIYKPQDSPEIPKIIALWNKWIQEDKIADGFYFIANLDYQDQKDEYIAKGFSAITPAPLQRENYKFKHHKRWIRGIIKGIQILKHKPTVFQMSEANRHIPDINFDKAEDVIPFIIPQWDHSPRSGIKGYIVKSSPALFEQQAEHMLSLVKEKRNQTILLKSWNEWAEGNYMEPDLTNGKGYINALRKAIDRVFNR